MSAKPGVDPKPKPTRITRETPPLGVPGMALCQKNLAATRPAPHKVHAGLPRGARCGLLLPATRQAAGVPSAWSQPSQSTHARPRRWCDAGSPGRQCVTAAQKAGVNRHPVAVTAAGNPTKPDRPALSRIRPTNFNSTDGQAGSPPPAMSAKPGVDLKPKPTRIRGKPRPIGVPGTPLCWNHLPAPQHAAHNGATGLPRGARHILVLPATRKAAGAPSAWSQPSQSTHARPRRWCDAGSPGRQCVTAAQKAGVEGTP